MNPRKLILLLLFMGIAAWMIWYWYPVWHPYVTHQQKHGLVTTVLLQIPDPSRALNYPDGTPTPAAWIMLVLLAAVGMTVYGLVSGPSKAHGSAKHATRRDTRTYRGNSRAMRLPRLTALLAPAMTLITYRPGWLSSKKQEQRLLLGTYGLSSITLSSLAAAERLVDCHDRIREDLRPDHAQPAP